MCMLIEKFEFLVTNFHAEVQCLLFVQSITTGLWSLFSLQYAASLTEVTFSTWSPFSRKNDKEMQSFESEADHVMRNQLIVLLFVCHTRAICRPLFRFSPRLWKICIFVHRLITFAYQVWSLSFSVVLFPPKNCNLFMTEVPRPDWPAAGHEGRGALEKSGRGLEWSDF